MGSLYELKNTHHRSFTFYSCDDESSCVQPDDTELIAFLNQTWPYTSIATGAGTLSDYATIHFTYHYPTDESITVLSRVFRRRDNSNTETSWARVHEET